LEKNLAFLQLKSPRSLRVNEKQDFNRKKRILSETYPVFNWQLSFKEFFIPISASRKILKVHLGFSSFSCSTAIFIMLIKIGKYQKIKKN
jgi:hypothetical protein